MTTTAVTTPDTTLPPESSAEPATGKPAPSLKARTITGSAWVIFANMLGQGVRLAGNLVLTRLLFPEAFGLMMLVQMVVFGLELVMDFGVYGSVINHRRGEERSFLNTAWTVQIIRGTTLWLFACALAWPMVWWFGYDELLYLIPVTGINSVLLGFQSIAVPLLNRRVMLGRITVLDFATHLVGVIVMIVGAIFFKSVWVLVVGGLVATTLKMIVSHRLVPDVRCRFQWDRDALHGIFVYGRWIMVSSSLMFLLIYSDRFIVGRVLTEGELGVYAIAVYLATSMLDIIQRLARSMLFPVYARLAEMGKEKLREKTLKVRFVLLAAALPGLWVAAIFGPWIVGFLYDDDYVAAGWMLQYLAIGVIGVVVSITASGVLLAVRDSFRYMILQVVRAVLLVAGMTLGYTYGGLVGLLVGMAASRFADYPVLAWAIRRYNTWLPGLDLGAFAASALVIAAGWYLMA